MVGMSVVYSLYDALVSINVPDAKAKAVIDALEREMMDRIATKADLSHVQELVSRDIKGVELSLAHWRETFAREIDRIHAQLEGLDKRVDACATRAQLTELDKRLDACATKAQLAELSAHVRGCATKIELAEFGRKLTTQLYLAIGGAAALTCSILGSLLVFLH